MAKSLGSVLCRQTDLGLSQRCHYSWDPSKFLNSQCGKLFRSSQAKTWRIGVQLKEDEGRRETSVLFQGEGSADVVGQP